MKRLVCPYCDKVALVDDRTFVHCAQCIDSEGYLTEMVIDPSRVTIRKGREPFFSKETTETPE